MHFEQATLRVAPLPDLKTGGEQLALAQVLADGIHVINVDVVVGNQVKAAVESIHHRPLAPRPRHDERDVLAVVGGAIEKRDAQRVVSPKRRIRNRDCVVRRNLDAQVVAVAHALVLRLDVNA